MKKTVMARRRPDRALLCLLSIVFVLALPVQAATDYRDHYRGGIAAVEAGDYGEATRLLRLAISGRQEARSGFRRYTPYYYLGVAQMESGDCRAALLTWTESESQGHIQKTREHPDLVSRKQRCEAQLGEVDQALSAAQSDIELAQQEVTKIERLSKDEHLAADWSKGSGSFATQQRQAEKLLRDAEQKVAAGETAVDPVLIAEGQELARQARANLQSIANEARQQLSAFDQALSEAAGKLDDVETGARRVLRSLEDLKPYPRELGRRVTAMEADLEAAQEAREGADPEQLTELQDQLTVTLSQLKRAAQRPPLKLVEAFQAYSVGEYEAAIEILDAGRFRRRAAAHACLLKAAARHALFLLDGEQATELLESARADVALCQQGSAPLEPSLDYFSPKFVAFHRLTVEQVAAGEISDSGQTEFSPASPER